VSKNPTDRVISSVSKNANKWQRRMGLMHWDIEHVFIDSYYDDSSGEDFKVTAITESRWQYMQARIKWYLPSAVRHSNDELEKVLVHELCHVLLAPEQALIDTKTTNDLYHSHSLGSDADALWERNYEHLELATEMATKAIMAGWEDC
jgi:hypothetical protein